MNSFKACVLEFITLLLTSGGKAVESLTAQNSSLGVRGIYKLGWIPLPPGMFVLLQYYNIRPVTQPSSVGRLG